MTTSVLQRDLHVHLYGCLTPQQLWERGRDRYLDYQDRLTWYAKEYQHALGRRPDFRSYWRDSAGIGRLERDFLCLAAVDNFHQFQARFNLIIALFPMTPDDTDVLALVTEGLRAQGIRYAELRVPLPNHFHVADVKNFLTRQAEFLVRNDSDGDREGFRLIISLPRDAAPFAMRYSQLRSWQRETHPQLRQRVVGIDFCGFEESYPPEAMLPLLKRIKDDNRADPTCRLPAFVHVGESFTTLSLASAIRWILTLAPYSSRLGHATAAACDPEFLIGRDITESNDQRESHHRWLWDNREWLADGGYIPPQQPTKFINKYDAEQVDDLKRFQRAARFQLARSGTVVECCPTSNFRMAGTHADAHPLTNWLGDNVPVVIGTDDPGIFATSLAREEELCRTQLGLDYDALATLEANARAYRADRMGHDG